MRQQTKIRVADNAGAVATLAAAEFVKTVQTALIKRGTAAVAIPGGSSPRRMHSILTRPEYRKAIDWKRVHLFWVDERLVPYYDADSNFGTACEDLIDPLQLDPDQVHPIPVTGDPATLAKDYEGALKKHFDQTSKFPVLDLICLGVGKDGHTASLFPDDPALMETRRWALAVTGRVSDIDRITLSLPAINAARRILFIVTGAGKSAVMHRVVTKPGANLPAQLVYPQEGSMVWMLDKYAAEHIQKNVGQGGKIVKI